ncbi:hypothetical protein TRVA0_002S01398 [Trichomonascus vanleenenianus]|uniref:ketopantoate reductase family protein n=1 Tax=Trichomonascus vanleenenianus TaxID=2268995 RepID=UPI003ECB04F4
MYNVLLNGLGGVGGVYAYVLQKSNLVNLSVIARSNYAPVKEQGLKFKSTIYGDHVVSPVGTYKTTADIESPDFDFIVCTNKALDPENLPNELRPVVTPGKTVIVVIQNGVGQEVPLQKAFPENPVLVCVTWVSAFKTGDGEVSHTVKELTVIGACYRETEAQKAADRKALDTFASILTAANSDIEVTDEIQRKRWEKCSWNAGLNPTTALTGLDTVSLFDSSEFAFGLSNKVWTEMVSIANKEGITFGDNFIEGLVKKIKGLGKVQTSMADDIRNNRPTEVEVILGNPLRLAKKHGLETPYLETLYTLVKGQDYRIKNRL